MTDFKNTAQVVIIGGGAVGVSCLYHLAKAGMTDCVLIEKNELTAGSTWHAAGNVPTFSSSWSIMNMQRYSTELFRDLGKTVEYPMNYHVTGSIRLAHTRERKLEFERAVGMGRYQGMDISMMAPEDLKEIYPFIETHDLVAVLHDPYDGDIDPAQLTQALAKGARDLGQTIQRFCPMTGIRRENNEWIVETPKGEIRCEYVVNSAGYYAQQVGEFFKPFGGRTVPMMVMEHQYILFEDIPEIAEWTKQAGHKLPLIRDVDVSYYLRQEKNGLNLGPYERRCKAHWATPEDPVPEDFSFQLYSDDLDRLEPYLLDAMARVPILEKTGLSKVINGPIPYTPDGNPLIGPMPGVKNAFEACVFTFGICQAGGAGKVLAEWITEGMTEWDMWSCDPRRFTEFCDHNYCVEKGMEVYGHEYAIHFPHFEWPAGRNKKLSPVHDRLASLGAQFGAYNGWERVNWFAKDGDDTSEESTFTFSRKGPWFIRVKEECEAVRDHAGIIDISGFSRFVVKGENSREWLDNLIIGRVPKPGRVGLGYFANENGRVLTEMSITARSEQEFLLTTAAAAQWHDYEWLKINLPEASDITIEDQTDKFCCHLVTGPNSRAILSEISEADLSLSWLSHQNATVAGKQCEVLRVSFAGELGWEIHSRVEDTPLIFDAIMKSGESHGLKPFGMFALNSLRLEKGYRAWKQDLSTDYSILQSGLDRFINWEKLDFVGKRAIENEKNSGVTRKCVTLIIDLEEFDAPYMSTVWSGDQVVGETTSGEWGHRIEKSLAIGMVEANYAKPNTKLEVEIFGVRYSAVVQSDKPAWDPNNERIRS